MSTLQTVLSCGVAASRPTAATTPIGALYYSTNVGITERNNGTTWDVFSGFGLIQEQLLVGDVATVTFTLPTTPYRHLRLVCYGRTTEAVTDNYVYLQFNADTAANYDYQQVTGLSTTVAGAAAVAQTKIRLGDFAGANASSANMPGHIEVDIPHYAGAVFDKLTNARSGSSVGTSAGTQFAGIFMGHWRNNAAITSIVLSPSANNFKTGSIFSLYGWL